MSMNIDQLVNRAMDLYDQLKADEELRKKAISFATHVKGIDIGQPEVEEDKGIIREYIKVITDVGDIYIPMQLYVTDSTQIHDTAVNLHEFINKSMMPIIKDMYESINKKSESLKNVNDDSFLSVLTDAIGKALLIVTDEKIVNVAGKIGENTSNIELIADTSDDRTFELVKIENVKNMDMISSITIDLLDFINKMWNSIIYPFIASMIHS